MPLTAEPDNPDAAISPLPAADRAKSLQQAIADAKPTHFVPLPDGIRQFPVARVPADLPVYRFDNGRLIAELHAHVHNTGEDIDTLRQTAESARTQSLLHRLLMIHATDARGPILPELRRIRQQTEPLLVTAAGVVVNGNRRLAAMRSLLAEDAQQFDCYATIDVAVLPADCTAADIDFIEAALQMVPETKLGYGWVNRRLKLRRQIETLKLPRDWVLAAYQIEDPALLERELGELALAERFLQERLKQPGQFAAIADAEALFIALHAQLQKLAEPLRAVWESVGFAMILARAELGKVVAGNYPFEPAEPRHLPSLALRRFARDKLHVAGEDMAEDATALADNMLDDLRSFFDGCGPKDTDVLHDLIDVMNTIREEQREAEKPTVMLQRVRRARAQMDRLTPERLTQEQRSVLRSEVAAIQAQAAYLLGEAPEHRFEQRKTTMVKAVSGYLRRWRETAGKS
ncbi:MAG: hypothetical protein ACXIVG_08300 [Pararhodobacter sp.]